MKNIVPIIVGLIIIAGIAFFTQNKNNDETQAVANAPSETQNIPEIPIDNKEIISEEILAPGVFVELAEVDIASLDGDIVLDFSAPWCPSCRIFKKDVLANLDNIPSNLTLILVDYDSNKDLRKQYAVRQQHTFVQIDNQGNKIKMWSGGNTLEDMLSKIQ